MSRLPLVDDDGSNDNGGENNGVIPWFKSDADPACVFPLLKINPFLTSKGISKSDNVLIFFFMLNLNQYPYGLDTLTFPESHSISVLVKSAGLNTLLSFSGSVCLSAN